jgi:molybdate transport system substrate-binding protein
LLLTAAFGTAASETRPLTVFAAVSLTDVMEDAGRTYTARTGRPVRFSFAASSVLARQIESGAPASVFVSADQDWMNYLSGRHLILENTRSNLAANSLVLIAPAGSKTMLRIGPGFALSAALGSKGRLATGDPTSVPAGKYARTALTRLGVWPSVAQRLVPADNARTALNFVARGEVPLGIVYATDAQRDARVRIVDVFPAGSHGPITYPAAATTNSGPEAREFVRFLAGPTGQDIFKSAGFAPP